MIHIVCALQAEAKPVIDYFRLTRRQDINSYPVYESEEILLIVSGIGQINAAATTGFLAGISPGSNGIWINIGIAGHHSHKIGSIHLAHEIASASQNRKWYPVIPARLPISTAPLISLDKATEEYPESLVDMEAYGFIETATRHSTLEWIQVIKVISDNQTKPATMLERNTVPELIGQHIDVISQVIAQLKGQITKALPDKENHNQALPEVSRLTRSEKNKLNTLVRKCRLLDRKKTDSILSENQENKKSLLAELELLLNDAIEI